MIQAEEMYLQSGLENNGCCIFLMCGGNEFQTEAEKGQNEKRHNYLSSCTNLYSGSFRRQVSALEQRGPMRGSGGLC